MLGHLQILFLWPTTPSMVSRIRYRPRLMCWGRGNRIPEDYSEDLPAQWVRLSNPLSMLFLEPLVGRRLLALKEGQMQLPLRLMAVGTRQAMEYQMRDRTRERMQE